MKKVVLAVFLAIAVPAFSQEKPTPRLRLAFSPNGKALAVASKSSVELWDVAARRRHWASPLPASPRGVAWADGGKALLVAAGPAILVLGAAEGKQSRTLSPHGKQVVALASSPDGKAVATASDDRTVLVRDWRADRVLAKLDGDTGEVGGVAFSADGSKLAVAGGRAASLHDAATGKRLHEFAPGRFHLASVAFAKGGVVTGGYDGRVRFWDAETGKQGFAFRGMGGVDGVAVDAAGRWLAARGSDFAVSLFDTDAGPPDAATAARLQSALTRLDDDSYDVREAASRDLRTFGFAAEKAVRRAVEASPSPEVRIRARVAHKALFNEPRELKGHTARLRDLAFSPDGKTLATCGDDGTVRLWDVASRKVRATLP